LFDVWFCLPLVLLRGEEWLGIDLQIMAYEVKLQAVHSEELNPLKKENSNPSVFLP